MTYFANFAYITYFTYFVHTYFAYFTYFAYILQKDYSQTRPMKGDQAGFEMTYF